MSASMRNYSNDGATQPERPESAFTARLRQTSKGSVEVALRLDRILQNLRGAPPPAPASIGVEVRQSCIGDYIGQSESAQKNIEEMLGEIENLIG